MSEKPRNDISNLSDAYSTPVECIISTTVGGLVKEFDLKYGENPSQSGAIYTSGSSKQEILYVRSDGKGKGGLSGTNVMDIARAMNVLKFFSQPGVVVMKHAIPSGVAVRNDTPLPDLYRMARDADRVSSFGGTAVFNRPIDKDSANALLELYPKHIVDVVAAPDFDEGVIGLIESKKNIRIAQFSGLYDMPKFFGDDTLGELCIKHMPTGRFLVQDPFLSRVRGVNDFILDPFVVGKDGVRHIVKRVPSDSELADLLVAHHINVGAVKSNGVVFVKDGVTVAVGTGQVQRLRAVEQAIVQGMQNAMILRGVDFNPLHGVIGYHNVDNPFEGAVCSSDAFFPFRDSIDTVASFGVSAIVQPFGSKNDAGVIDAANDKGLAMVCSLERCFDH